MMTTPADYLAQINAACAQARAACTEAARHRDKAKAAHDAGNHEAFESHADRWEAAMQYAREQIDHGGELQRRLETEHPIPDEETNTMSNLEAPGFLEHAEHPVCSECRMCITCADCRCKSRERLDDVKQSDPADDALRAAHAALSPPELTSTWPLSNMLESAWGIIANAGHGNWETQSPEWQLAAVRWRESYHQLVTSGAVGDDPVLEFSAQKPSNIDRIGAAIGAVIALAFVIALGIILIAAAARAAFYVMGIDIQ